MTNQVYLLPIQETIGAAWDKIKGSKKSIWGALFIIFVTMFILGIIEGILQEYSKPIANGFNFLLQVFAFLLQMGMMYIGIRRAQDLPISHTQVFYTFQGNVAIRVLGLYLLQVLIFIIPTLIIISGVIVFQVEPTPVFLIIGALLCAAGIVALLFVAVRITFSMAFVLDKLYGPWNAIIQSYNITRGNFWRLITLIILQCLIVLVSIIPLGIGLVWTIPFTFIMYGTMYQRLLVNNSGQQ